MLEHYRALARHGIDVDVIDEHASLEGYKLVVAPMLYMVKPGLAERLESFVKNGGTFVATCHTGCVDQDDLCFLGGFPGPLRPLMGIWIEEIDALYDDEQNGIRMADNREYACSTLCDLIHAETAQVLGTYASDFYAGTPAVTVNDFGAGHAYYIASRPDDAFLKDFYAARLSEAGIAPLVENLPAGVQVASRQGQDGTYLFVMNFSRQETRVCLPKGEDLLTGQAVGGDTLLPENGILILKEAASCKQ